MSGVFLSYSRGDRALADQVIRGLRGLGVDVWWDEDMPGVDWQEELARQIKELAAVVVIWTPLSTNSKNVRDEARLGQTTDKLVNVLAGVPAPPFPFDRTNGLPLDGWSGREPHGGWSRLVSTIEDRLVAVGAATAGQLKDALGRRDQTIRERRHAVATAEEAYRAAKADEDAAALACDTAITNFHATEAQLRHVVDIKASPALLRVAQSEFDAALSARETADEARKSAAAALAAASRALTRARTDLEGLFDAGTPEPHAPEHMPEALPGAVAAGALAGDASASSAEGSERVRRPGRRDRTARPAGFDARVAERDAQMEQRRDGRRQMHPAAAQWAGRRPPNAVPWIFGGCAVAVAAVCVVLVVGISSVTTLVRSADAVGRGRVAPVVSIGPEGNVTVSQAPAPANPADAAQQALVGDPRVAALAGQWAAPGADCDEASMGLSVTPDAKLTVQMDKRVASTAITGVSADGAVEVASPQGPWSYAVNDKSLTMTPPKGPKLVFSRCEE